MVREGCGGLAIRSHVTSFAGREIGTVSILKSTARITTCFSKAFGMQGYPRLRCAVRQGCGQGFAANPLGVRIRVAVGPWSECFQLTGLLGPLTMGLVGNLAFSLVWVLKQGLSFPPCDGKPHEQPPIPGSLYTSVVESCCWGNEGWIAARSIIRATRSRS